MSTLNSKLEWHFEDRYYYLFVSLALLLLLPPFLITFKYLSYTIYLLLTFVIVNCSLILFDKSRKFGYGLIALLLTVGFLWLSIANDWKNPVLQVIRMIIMALFFGFTFAKMVGEIFKLERVTGRVVVGAIGAYLLLGFIGAFLFEIVQLLYPNSFTNMDLFAGGFYGELYFSFVTISTLGYGDISPLTAQGQAVAIFVAISGQLYLAILMAMLVGKFLASKNN
jgi:voltage-gated potassium channel